MFLENIILLVFIIFIYIAVILSQKNTRNLIFNCSKCNHSFNPYLLRNQFLSYIINGPLYFSIYLKFKPKFFLRCPNCKKFSWCSSVEKNIESDSKILTKENKTNRKYILVAIILISIIGVGIFGYQYFWSPISFELTPLSIEKVEDQTANWEIYRNEEYGFEIKYPQDWRVEEEKGSFGYMGFISFIVNFKSPQDPGPYNKLAIIDNKDRFELEEYYAKLKEEVLKGKEADYQVYFPFVDYVPKKKLTINDNYFYQFMFPGVVAEKGTIFSYGKYIFDFGTFLLKVGNTDIVHRLETYDQMLSTFKFLE